MVPKGTIFKRSKMFVENQKPMRQKFQIKWEIVVEFSFLIRIV